MRTRAILIAVATALTSSGCCLFSGHDWETPDEAAARVRAESERQRQREHDETRAAAMMVAERAIRERRCEGCVFTYATFDGSDLSGGQFARASFGAAQARGVNLSGADLTGADLGGDFTGADFRRANLSGAQLSGGTFRLARFDGVDLRTVEWPEGATWSETVFEGANLEGLFHGPHGRRNRSTPGHVYGVSNGGTDLSGANFRNARLGGATFENCSLRGADLSGADLTDAGLSGADLQGADLRGSSLLRAQFLAADLRRANLEGANIRAAEFSVPGRPQAGALLSEAVWIDGRQCELGSVGRCVRSAR